MIAAALCCLQGCAYLGALRHTYSAQAVPAQQFRFHDGGQAIYFSLDKSLRHDGLAEAGAPVETLLFVISGSDCTSMQYFLPQYFRGLEGESGPLRIFILQKRHIDPRTWGRSWGCSEEFIRADHPAQWIADQSEFIHAQLALVRTAPMRPRRIVLAGISEGGEIVPSVAQFIPDLTHAVIVANGGMDPINAYRLQASRHGFTSVLDALPNLAQPMPADPDAVANRIGGRTWRYWDELKQIKYAENLLALQIPLLVAMGDADQSVPIESAWALREGFSQHGKSNLTLLVYPGADHALQSGQRSHLADFWHALDLWLAK